MCIRDSDRIEGRLTDQQTFAKSELPQSHRVVKSGDMMTMDHNPDR